MTRIWNVVRLHLVNRWTYIVLPWIILGTAFAMTLAIWMILRSVGVTGIGVASGAVGSIFIYLMVAAIMSINLTFPFALGFSVTRRDFWLGSALTFITLSAVYSAGLTILAAIEVATDGWGLGGTMFASFYFGGADASWLERFGLYFATYLFFYFVGAAIATIYQRWRNNGMLALFGTLGLVLIAGIALVSFTNSWPAVGAWFDSNGPSGVIAWSLVPTVVAAVTGYFILRRATPKN